ncbi:MAG: ABC transporter ATP-binding protein [Crenarchaeota archaeon]|nr:ABC transporter ATP-binding protein [Thermoproteota archaeon]MDW8034596.1 ABC transporter ATP-binding protein [Nitrososphaerota archaeon]
MSFVIECENLVKVFKSKPPIRALDEVSIKVPRGCIFGLFGPNGAGKSTLISILIGLTLPTSGSAKVLGYDTLRESLEIRKRVGVLPEGFSFYDNLTALQNLKYLGMLDGIPPDEVEKTAIGILNKVGLADRVNTKVSKFSRGMKQKLGIAQALLKNPELLIFDEPTVGVDPEGVIQFREFIQSLVKDGKTIFLSTHLLRDLGVVCTHTAIIRRGKIVVQGSMEELTQKMKGVKGYGYEIHIKTGDVNRLAEELRKFPRIIEVRIEGINKLKAFSEEELGNEIFMLLSKGGYQVEAMVSLKPEWEDLYKFYSEVS